MLYVSYAICLLPNISETMISAKVNNNIVGSW